MEALITIGIPSVKPTIELLATDENELRRTLGVKVLRYVEGPDVAVFVLQKASSSEEDAGRKALLSDALKRMQKLIDETR